MVTTILGLIGGAATIIGGVLAYKNSANRQRRAAESDVAAKEAEAEARKGEIREAVYGNDEGRVNAIADRLLARAALAAALGAALCGCAGGRTVVRYVSADRRIEACTNSQGYACQAVPNAVFCEMLERVQELKDLKREMAVDKRLLK